MIPGPLARAWTATLFLALPAAGGCALFPRAAAPESSELSELVEPDPEIESRDLFYGAGGRSLEPPSDRRFQFLAYDDSGSSPGMEVKDTNGRLWDVKLGPEVQTEVVVSRLLWAIGFHQPPTYYLDEWTLVGGGERAGRQAEARFRPEELSGWQESGNWSWSRNSFVGTRELGALIAAMLLFNNWDLKTSQNVIYARSSDLMPRRMYVVRDLGATLGRTGWPKGTKNDLPGFESEPFVRETRGDRVEFHFEGAWREPGIAERVEVADLLWLCRRLERLRHEQWLDAFRAADYPEGTAARFVARLKQKVQEGLRIESVTNRRER